METTNQTTFTKIKWSIKKKFQFKITSIQKYILYILGWQLNGLTLTTTNSYIAKERITRFVYGGIHDLNTTNKSLFFLVVFNMIQKWVNNTYN
jgi:hypothetical protein